MDCVLKDGVCMRCGWRWAGDPDVHRNCWQRSYVGTELKAILRRLGFQPTPGCKCQQRALLLDRQSIDWSEANLALIVSWLAEEAAKRGLPFLDLAGYLLVKLAIRRAKKRHSLDQVKSR